MWKSKKTVDISFFLQRQTSDASPSCNLVLQPEVLAAPPCLCSCSFASNQVHGELGEWSSQKDVAAKKHTKSSQSANPSPEGKGQIRRVVPESKALRTRFSTWDPGRVPSFLCEHGRNPESQATPDLLEPETPWQGPGMFCSVMLRFHKKV